MNKMDHSQHSLESHDHSMHHSMHSGASAPPHHGDHGAIMMMTTAATPLIATTENPANIHLHHSALDYDTTTAASHLGHDMMAMGGHVHGGAAATSSSPHTAMHHMMSMSFHFGYDETILFDWWKIDSVGGLLASMLAIFILAILYEGLKYYREYLFWKTYNLLEYRPVTGPQANAESGPTRSQPQTTASPVHPRMLSKNHIFQTFLHMIQVTLSFLLMLIFMTYNVWLCLAVVFGAAIGYFVFCWKKSVIVDVTEHCH